MLNNNNFNQIFLDFDGVICDSNSLKAENIFKASSIFTDENNAKKFTEFFIKNNGIPREYKTIQYFRNEILAEKILVEYEKLNENLIDAVLNPGLLEFLEFYDFKEIFILSGGSKYEIKEYLNKKNIVDYFDAIFCGPKTKEQNLKNINIAYPALFIGDSVHDYEVAKKFNLDFIFMYGATQVFNWKEIMPGIKKTKDYKTLLENNFHE